MVVIFIICVLLILILIRSSPSIDVIKTVGGYAVLLWYNKWVEEKGEYTRNYKVLFKFKNL